MRKSKAFTLIELLIVMAVIAILIAIAIPSFRGMQDEARKTKAQGDVRVLKIAVESWYKNHSNEYPLASTTGTGPAATWETILTGAYPRILDAILFDPFVGSGSSTQYMYKTDSATLADAKYYVIYSVGPSGTGYAAVATNGTVTTTGDAVVETNGH